MPSIKKPSMITSDDSIFSSQMGQLDKVLPTSKLADGVLTEKSLIISLANRISSLVKGSEFRTHNFLIN